MGWLSQRDRREPRGGGQPKESKATRTKAAAVTVAKTPFRREEAVGGEADGGAKAGEDGDEITAVLGHHEPEGKKEEGEEQERVAGAADGWIQKEGQEEDDEEWAERGDHGVEAGVGEGLGVHGEVPRQEEELEGVAAQAEACWGRVLMRVGEGPVAAAEEFVEERIDGVAGPEG